MEERSEVQEENEAIDETPAESRMPRLPLEETAATLDQRWGLYLSPEQQRYLGGALFLGAVLTAGVLAFTAASAIRRTLG